VVALGLVAPAAMAEERPAVPRSPEMVHAGMVMTGLGGFAVVTGGLVVLQTRGAEPQATETRAAGAIIAASGAVLLAVGIPVWTIGATRVVSTGSLSVGPGGMTLRGSF